MTCREGWGHTDNSKSEKKSEKGNIKLEIMIKSDTLVEVISYKDVAFKEGDTERDGQRDRQKVSQKETGGETDRDRHRERPRQGGRETHTERERERETKTKDTTHRESACVCE